PTAVRSALREELHRRPGQEVRDLRRKVAQWSLAHGRELAALATAVEIGDLDLASRVIRAAGLPLLQAHGRAIRGLLEPVALVDLARHPLLAMTLGICLNAHADRRLRAIALFGIAAVASRRTGRTSAVGRALIRRVESAALRVAGVGDAGAKAARTAALLLQDMTLAEREELGALGPTLYAQSGLSLYYSGDVGGGLRH